MNPVTAERTRSCVRCHERFTEPAGTVTRICDDCRSAGASATRDAVPESAVGNGRERTSVGNGRERTCVRCGEPFPEGPGEISRLCPACDPDHVVLDDE